MKNLMFPLLSPYIICVTDGCGKMIIGTQAYPHGPSAIRILSLARMHGFGVVEIVLEAPNNLEGFVTKKRKELKKEIIECGVPVLIHAPFSYIDPASSNERVRTSTINELVETVMFAHELGVKIVTVHAPDYPILTGKVSSLYIDTIRRLVGEVEEADVILAIENTFQNAEQFLKMINQISNSRIAITYDAGHANLRKDPVKFLMKIPLNRIINVHLHDNNGRKDSHLPVGSGNIDFVEILRVLKAVRYRGPLIIEHIRWSDFLESKKKIEQMLEGLT